ncbi:MAG: hypothetical protein ABFD50_10530 [Smithella sp.]
MTRRSTNKKHRIVVREFLKLVRSGKDYTTESMYREVADKLNFIEAKTVGNVIREHYKNMITGDMKEFLENMEGNPHETKIQQFSVRYNVCTRESRLMIRYMGR